jgi:Family of unknown function (DUF6356)
MLKRLFVEHPQSVGETYGEHLSVASWYGMRLLGAGLACMVHAVLPFLFVRTGSVAIERLHGHMTGRLGPLDTGKSSGRIPAPGVAGIPVKES